MNHPPLSIDVLERVVAAFPSDDLSAARTTAFKKFRKSGFPTQRVEDWKYTDLSNVIDISERWLTLDGGKKRAAVNKDSIRHAQQLIDAAWLVIANGRLIEDLSPGLQEDGLSIERLSGAAAGHDFDEPLSDLNMLLLIEGLRIQVNTDKSLHRPIGILVVDNAGASAVMSQVRVDIELSDGSRARIVELHVSDGKEQHYSNAVVNLTLAKGARADYMRLQDRSPQHSQTQRTNIRLDENSELRHCGFDFGGKLARNDLHVAINGQNALVSLHGLYIANDGQHIDNHTRIDHKVGPATSTQEYRGILGGRCRCVWNGKAIVHKGADGTDAEQANHNLLLSDNAEIDAKPELEIYADDVKCAHGTTVGQLDEAALFYLQTRGLDKQHAQRVLTRAFAESIVDKSPIAEMHEWLSATVESRLALLSEGVVS